MKKRIYQWLIAMGVMTLVFGGLTGCGEENSDSSRIEEEEEEVDSSEDAEENASADVETSGEAQGADGTDTSVGTELVYVDPMPLAMEDAEELIMPLTQWAGLYMMGYIAHCPNDMNALKAEIAGVSAGYGCVPGMEPEDNMFETECSGTYRSYFEIANEDVQSAAQFFFGENVITSGLPDLSQGDGVAAKVDGTVYVMVGDWGLVAPKAEITSIVNMGSIYNYVTVEYVLFDYEEGTVTEELGTVDYLVEGTGDTEEVPRIIEITVYQTYEDPFMYEYENWKSTAGTFDSAEFTMQIPAAWEGRYYCYTDNEAMHFISTVCEEENYTGELFSIVLVSAETANAYDADPDCSHMRLGQKGSDVYVALFPTEEPRDSANPYSVAEYSDMNNYVSAILSTFEVK